MTNVEVTSDELDVAFDGPAPFANKFYVTLNGPFARIAFTEQGRPNAKPSFRSAVIMSAGDLLQLKDLIEELEPKLKAITIEGATESVTAPKP